MLVYVNLFMIFFLQEVCIQKTRHHGQLRLSLDSTPPFVLYNPPFFLYICFLNPRVSLRPWRGCSFWALYYLSSLTLRLE